MPGTKRSQPRTVKARMRCTACPWTAIRSPTLTRCPKCGAAVARDDQ